MKVVFLTGDHARHSYMARKVMDSGCVVGVIIEERENFLPEPPPGVKGHLADLFCAHFAARETAERLFFGQERGTWHDVEILKITREKLNSRRVCNFLDEVRPDLMLSYGVHKISDGTLSHAPGAHWNIHGGLSPWYRGNITHFWPSYHLEPQVTGMTVHEITQDIDGGPVVHQSAAELVRGDGIHELACRAVTRQGTEIARLIRMFSDGQLAPARSHATTGRIWRGSDWRPEHLRVIYDLYENRIVDRYLDGKLAQRSPKLIRQF